MIVQTASIDFTAIKERQQATWDSGDYTVIGTTLQIVGETLCEAVDLRSNQRVLDVAAGNGNATLAAARSFAEVVSTDYIHSLLAHGRVRAAADQLKASFLEAGGRSPLRRMTASMSCCRPSASCSRQIKNRLQVS